MKRARRAAGGLSLIELMIAMALSVVMTLALGTFMLQGTRSGREDINIASMLDELGYAAALLTSDLEMAGFWAPVHDPSVIELDGTLTLGGTDCGAANWYRTLTALELLDNNTGASGGRPMTAWSCLDAGDVMPGTDIVAIKRVMGRVAGTDTVTSGMQPGLIYLRTHDKVGRLYLHGGTPGAVDTPYRNWQYAPAVYYVQRWSVSSDESPMIPSLHGAARQRRWRSRVHARVRGARRREPAARDRRRQRRGRRRQLFHADAGGHGSQPRQQRAPVPAGAQHAAGFPLHQREDLPDRQQRESLHALR
jgi:hypothetical protein